MFHVENPLSSRIIGGEFDTGETVVVDLAGEKLTFHVKVPVSQQ